MMFKRLLGDVWFILLATLGIVLQLIIMILATAEGNESALYGLFVTFIMMMWVDDVEGEWCTRRQNGVYILIIFAAILLMCAFVSNQQISPVLLGQMIIEFVFLLVIGTDYSWLLP